LIRNQEEKLHLGDDGNAEEKKVLKMGWKKETFLLCRVSSVVAWVNDHSLDIQLSVLLDLSRGSVLLFEVINVRK
jgi:hypothetical protein